MRFMLRFSTCRDPAGHGATACRERPYSHTYILEDSYLIAHERPRSFY